jgi:hypothetical protein
MTKSLRRIGRAAASIIADSRSEFHRIDASPARYDDGSWLSRRR